MIFNVDWINQYFLHKKCILSGLTGDVILSWQKSQVLINIY